MLSENLTRLSMSLIFCFLLVSGSNFEKKYDEEEAKEYLEKINADIQVKTTESVLASWAYESNITDENLRYQLEVSAKLANYTKEIWKETIKYPWKTFKDPDIKRQFQKFSVLGTAILSPPKYERFNKIISDMQSVYGKAKVCDYHNQSDCNMQLEPELTEILAKSRDPDELKYYWEQWRNVAGKPVRNMYKEYVDLSNEAAVLNNFTDSTQFWLKDYEAKDFKEQVEALWEQLRPLYLQLHAFVRRRLREQYGEQHVSRRGPIPAHLLGNMWGQSWGNTFNFTAPYPDKPNMDVTPVMVEQGYTPLRMFKLAEEFFTSLNLSPMPDTFWKNSILEKPSDGRDLICHASAWDFYDGKDFRIKQCSRITMEDLNTVHHEMGHVQYFLQYKSQPLVYKEGSNPGRKRAAPLASKINILLIKQCTRVTFRQLVVVHHEMGHIQYDLQYKDQPKIYRRGANPGFHEAVGDVMALSVSTPKHLRKIGLLNDTESDEESEINQLFRMALDKIAFLPFGYLMDQWRWSVFEGTTTERDYNCKWWQLREKYQGLSPSVTRSEEDFDPGAKYHTVGNVPYIRYFVSFVIQFQFHRSLCIAANEFSPDDPTSKPLHKCDIYQSKEAGALLKKMLQMGSSKPWPDAMEVITGQRKMDARALLDYFASLQTWLEKENERTGEFIGWEASQKVAECNREVVGTEEGKISNTQGNFEEDNIAYSYAEFVRQDDNSFGFPDYMEEVQPSYHTMGCGLKEKSQDNYFLPKRNVLAFSETNNLLLPKRSYLLPREEDKFIDIIRPQRFSSRPEEESVKKLQKKRFYNIDDSKIIKVPVNVNFEKRTKRKSANMGQKNKEKRNEEAHVDNKLSENRAPKRLAEKEAVDPSENQESKKRDTEDAIEISVLKNREDLKPKNQEELSSKSESKRSKFRRKNFYKAEDSQNKRFESKMIDNNYQPNNNKLSYFYNHNNNKVSYNDNSNSNDCKMDPNAILSLAKETSTGKLGLGVSDEILWQAEKVKKEAEKMLNKLDFEIDPNTLLKEKNSFRWSSDKDSAAHRSSKKTRSAIYVQKTSDYATPGNTIKIQLQPNKDLLKNSGIGKKNEKLVLRGFNYVGLIPVENKEGGTEQKLNGEKLLATLNKKSDSNLLLLIGKLSENKLSDSGFKKKIQKKSYTEYHCCRKGPPSYNEVIINKSSKAEKPDYSKKMWMKGKGNGIPPSFLEQNTNRNGAVRNIRDLTLEQSQGTQTQFFNDKFSNSVRNNKYNIKNIVQYFGCLQLLI